MPDELRDQKEFAQHVANLREVPLGELFTTFSREDIETASSFQEGIETEELVKHPLPSDFVKKYGEQVTKLYDNTQTYDDDTEDAMVDDNVIQEIMLKRRGNESNKELTAAMRTRRSVIAFLLHHSLEERLKPPA